MRLAVAIARVRLDADQVITRKLRLETVEHGRAGAVDREHIAAGRVRERFEADDANPAILNGRRRPPSAVRVEAGFVDVEHVQAGARRGGEETEVSGEGLRIVDDETLGDQDKGFRRVDRPQAREQVDQAVNGGVRLLERLPRNLTGVVFDAGTADRILV